MEEKEEETTEELARQARALKSPEPVGGCDTMQRISEVAQEPQQLTQILLQGDRTCQAPPGANHPLRDEKVLSEEEEEEIVEEEMPILEVNHPFQEEKVIFEEKEEMEDINTKHRGNAYEEVVDSSKDVIGGSDGKDTGNNRPKSRLGEYFEEEESEPKPKKQKINHDEVEANYYQELLDLKKCENDERKTMEREMQELLDEQKLEGKELLKKQKRDLEEFKNNQKEEMKAKEVSFEKERREITQRHESRRKAILAKQKNIKTFFLDILLKEKESEMVQESN